VREREREREREGERVQDLGISRFKVWGVGFGVCVLGFRIYGIGCRV
jgi:hypothetical protein